LSKLREEVDELAAAEALGADEAERETGDVLFATVAVARKLGVDAESALRRTTRTFSARYERMMALAIERGIDMSAMTDEDLLGLFSEARGEQGVTSNKSPS
jgi:uncharacterized protein YabN with tetrapyrrole methylase and pyrophosphatase domain